jgi:iron complex transport system substrate-binding protein
MRPTALLAVLLPVVLAASACGIRSEPTGSLPPFPAHLVDGLGRGVTVPRRPVRVLSFAPGLARTMAAIGAGGVLMKAPAGLTALDTARIRALRPDLVLLPATASAGSADALSRTLGAPVYVAGYGSVAAIEHDVDELGLATGRAAQGGALAARMTARVAAIARALRGRPPTPVFLDAGLFVPVPESPLVRDLLRLAGGRNVAAGSDPQQPFPPARLRAAAPQAFVAVRGRGTTLRELRRSARTRTLPAVRNGRFVSLRAIDLTDPGPDVIGTLNALVRVLHPGAIPSAG